MEKLDFAVFFTFIKGCFTLERLQVLAHVCKESSTMNIHLHGHLTECIRNYGPVYSFWCFAYERMNGVLGAYHTNNHHVSVQYMSKFLESKLYAPSNWPGEFTDAYLPLLEIFVYNKGSLMQKNLETELSTCQYSALPPVKEFVLLADQKSNAKQFFAEKFGINICLSVGDYVIGSMSSRHSKSSLVLVQGPITLAEVLYYLECTAICNSGEYTKMWFAYVSTFLEHPCKLWYGHPVLVWTTVKSPQMLLVPVYKVKISCCVRQM